MTVTGARDEGSEKYVLVKGETKKSADAEQRMEKYGLKRTAKEW